MRDFWISLPEWLQELLPIVILLAVIAGVMRTLPKVDMGHTAAFRRRRALNWLPLGFTYAFLYMGRYNLNVAKTALGDSLTKQDFATIFMVGTLVYGVSFIINGPLTDRLGGKVTIIAAALGASVTNALMGAVLYFQVDVDLVTALTVLYALNMYFQSFGAVSIVKVKAPWFHVRERGVFGGVFGILISLGIYFAYDWGRIIVDSFGYVRDAAGQVALDATGAKLVSVPGIAWVFFIPAILLVVWAVIDFFLVVDHPEDVGFTIDTGDANAYDDGPAESPRRMFGKMLTNPIILTVCAIEFCSGYLRQAIMQWYMPFAKEVGAADGFVASNWGMVLCVAGILGGMFAGAVSDHLFQSRRGPVAAFLYGIILVGSGLMFVTVASPGLHGWLVAFMSLAIIGVHGMLSGSASIDFGGKKNTGLAVGIIDGFVYLGTGLHALVLGIVLPSKAQDAFHQADPTDPANWWTWAAAMVPVALIGLFFSARMWNTRPPMKSPAPH